MNARYATAQISRKYNLVHKRRALSPEHHLKAHAHQGNVTRAVSFHKLKRKALSRNLAEARSVSVKAVSVAIANKHQDPNLQVQLLFWLMLTLLGYLWCTSDCWSFQRKPGT